LSDCGDPQRPAVLDSFTKADAQTDHIRQLVGSFLSVAKPHCIVQSFRNGGLSLIKDDCVIRGPVAPSKSCWATDLEALLDSGSSECLGDDPDIDGFSDDLADQLL
jgi:hypothetical protein